MIPGTPVDVGQDSAVTTAHTELALRTCPAPGCRRAPANGTRLCTAHTPPPDIPGPFLGLSYRQLDYWTRVGYLRPHNPAPGSGTTREWPDHEVVVAHLIVRLLHAGLTLPAAARAARDQADHPDGIIRLRGNIHLDLDPTPYP